MELVNFEWYNIPMENISQKITANVKAVFHNVITGEDFVIEKHNISCTAGKESTANRLAGGTNKGVVTYLALGTGAVTGGDTPDATDTQLVTELIRKLISVRSASGLVASFRTFFNTSEANDTLTEIGLFGDDASVTANSGVLYARAAISKTKTSSETLTIDWAITVG